MTASAGAGVQMAWRRWLAKNISRLKANVANSQHLKIIVKYRRREN
jgi:hypothetical protein